MAFGTMPVQSFPGLGAEQLFQVVERVMAAHGFELRLRHAPEKVGQHLNLGHVPVNGTHQHPQQGRG